MCVTPWVLEISSHESRYDEEISNTEYGISVGDKHIHMGNVLSHRECLKSTNLNTLLFYFGWRTFFILSGGICLLFCYGYGHTLITCNELIVYTH